MTDDAILQKNRAEKCFYTKTKQDAVKNKLIYGEYVIPAAIFERFERREQYEKKNTQHVIFYAIVREMRNSQKAKRT